ncbi:MAG TPA: hypothetical protein DDW52_24060, partial [Planctomycetaceae bacterium]|nr:hypothetical protein [Planctomycetaceae bacterium]
MPDDKFLHLAVQEGLLSDAGAQKVAFALQGNNATAKNLCLQMGEMTAAETEAIDGLLKPNSVADGYTVEGVLGRGGSGFIYRARQAGLDRIVALKTISISEMQAETRAKATVRFEQEAKVVAKLQHPNIVTAFNAGTTKDRIYLAMELVHGKDLDNYVSERGQLDETAAWQIALQVAEALAHAKKFNIVHRDIKPSNLLISDPVESSHPLPSVPLVKVTDFGLARLIEAEDESRDTRITLEGITLGTPHYMAPEQVDSAANVDFQADIYALGATVFHMLAGKAPWAELRALNVLGKKMAQMPAPIEGLPASVSDGTKVLIARMLEPVPADRHANYAELQSDIRCLLTDLDTNGNSANADLTAAGALQREATPDSQVGLGEAVDSKEVRKTRNSLGRSQGKSPGKFLGKSPRNFLGVGLLIVAAAILLLAVAVGLVVNRSGDPVRQFEESQRLDATRPLYLGQSIADWQGVARASLSGDEAGMLQVLSTARVSIEEARNSLPDPDHYGISVRVQVANGSSLEIWYDVATDGVIQVVRIADQQLTLGYRANLSEPFVAVGPAKNLETSALAPNPVIRIDRDEEHWFVGQSVPGEPPPP